MKTRKREPEPLTGAEALLDATGPFRIPRGALRANAWERWVRMISGVAAAVAGILMLFMTIHIVVDVGGRVLFNHPLTGTSEFVQFWWMPIVGLMGLAATELKNEHIHVSLMSDGNDNALQRVVNIFAAVVSLGVSVWMLYLSWMKLMDAFRISESVVGLAWAPMWPIRLVVVISFLLFVVAIATRLHRFIFVAPKVEEEIEALGS